MKMNEKTKKILTLVAALVLVLAIGIWFLLDDTSHIEDTNGPDNYKLQTITDGNIIKKNVGAIGGPDISRNTLLGDTVKFSAEKFTGVYEILYDNFIFESDFQVTLTAFEIYEGNFEIAVVYNDEIVATLEPGILSDYLLEDVTGYVSLRIAGESASFIFYMTEDAYDLHSHAE